MIYPKDLLSRYFTIGQVLKTLALFQLFMFLQPCLGQQKFKGYPHKGEDIDILPGFIQPPKGYGNVPFYWWNGDSLNRDRLREELEILASSATEGFAVSYIHLHAQSDAAEMSGSYGLFGKTEPGRPKVFSDEWWDIWSWFAEACAEKNIGLGFDDYTIGWTGNGYYTDELMNMPKFKNYRGELVFEVVSVPGNSLFSRVVPDHTLAVIAINNIHQQPIDLTSKVSSDNRILTEYRGRRLRKAILKYI